MKNEAAITHFKNFDRYHSHHYHGSNNFNPAIVRSTTALSGVGSKMLICALPYSKEQLRGVRK